MIRPRVNGALLDGVGDLSKGVNHGFENPAGTARRQVRRGERARHAMRLPFSSSGSMGWVEMIMGP